MTALDTPAALLDAHDALWQRATHHPFLDGVREDTLDEDAFARWLVQDYHFARALVTAEGAMLGAAPRADQALLVGGLVAMEEELSWFEDNARRLGLALDQPLLPACRAYTDFLLALDRRPYAAQITALWALERAYLEGWRTAQPAPSAYEEFVARWTNDDFAGYVEALEAAAARALNAAPEAHRAAAEDAFRWTARYERDFWQMAFEAPSDPNSAT